jgi:hypothetical protein
MLQRLPPYMEYDEEADGVWSLVPRGYHVPCWWSVYTGLHGKVISADPFSADTDAESFDAALEEVWADFADDRSLLFIQEPDGFMRGPLRRGMPSRLVRA